MPDPILLWNKIALEADRVAHTNGRGEQTGPTLSSRALAIVHLAVFAAEVDGDEVKLGAGHSEYAWLSADEAKERLSFRGLKEGLHWVRTYVTESKSSFPELRLG